MMGRILGNVFNLSLIHISPTAKKSDMTLPDAVIGGLKEMAGRLTQELLQTTDPLEIINQMLIPALDRVGDDFESGKIFLPQLIQSATAAQAGFEQIKLSLSKKPAAESVSKGKIVLATEMCIRDRSQHHAYFSANLPFPMQNPCFPAGPATPR